MKHPLQTSKAPPAIGPYSQGIDAGQVVFLSGQLPVHPETGKVTGDIKAQTRQVFANIAAVLDVAGLTLANVVKCQVFLTDMALFADMNAVYEEAFKPHGVFPARTTVQVAALPLGLPIEIDAIAVRP